MENGKCWPHSDVWDHDDRASSIWGDDSSWVMRSGRKGSWKWGYQELRDQDARQFSIWMLRSSIVNTGIKLNKIGKLDTITKWIINKWIGG